MSFLTGSGNTLPLGQTDGRRLQLRAVESNPTMGMKWAPRILFVATFLVASTGAAMCDARCNSLGLAFNLATCTALAGPAHCCHGNSPAPERHPSRNQSPQQCAAKVFTASTRYSGSAVWAWTPLPTSQLNPLILGPEAVAFVSDGLFLPTQPAGLLHPEAGPLPLRI